MHGLDHKGMISEIPREVSVLQDINDTTSDRVLLWAQRVEAQRAQKEALENIKETKNFDLIGQNTQRQNNVISATEVSGKLQALWNGAPPRDRPLHMKIHVEVTERPTTSGQCASQCQGSSNVRNHQGVEGQSMTSGKRWRLG